jgi:TRAP-type uncharacterized transport system fused permease subunit
MFVFYYATLSVITPPVCVAVFLAAGIAQTGWPAVARRALALGAVTYVIPFLYILYPGLLDPTTDLFAVAEAFLSGSLFVIGFAALFGNLRVTGHGLVDRVAWLIVAVIAVYPHWFGIVLSIGLIAGYWALRRRQGFHFVRPENLPEPVPPAFDKCC